MPSRTSESTVEWLSLTCPSCKFAFRIKAVHAHLRGRCPECGRRIEAPRPRPRTASAVSDSDEPLGLEPVEEEWPEPPQPEPGDKPRSYDLASAPTSWPEQKLPPPALPEPYTIASEELPPPPPPAALPAREAYSVEAVHTPPGAVEP